MSALHICHIDTHMSESCPCPPSTIQTRYRHICARHSCTKRMYYNMHLSSDYPPYANVHRCMYSTSRCVYTIIYICRATYLQYANVHQRMYYISRCVYTIKYVCRATYLQYANVHRRMYYTSVCVCTRCQNTDM